MVKPELPSRPQAVIFVENIANGWQIINGEYRYRFDKLKGIFTAIEKNGVPMIEQPLDFNIWRAPTDNDRLIREFWQKRATTNATPEPIPPRFRKMKTV